MTSTRPTLRDIAQLAGTSPMTVSRALNDKPGVGQDTAARIRAIADELGYQRNELAVALRRNTSTGTIGLVLEHARSTFYQQLIAGVQQVAAANDALVLTATSGTTRHEHDSVLALTRSRVDGLLVVPSLPDGAFEIPEQAATTPVVFVDREPARAGVDCVIADDVGGAWAATRHLLAHGHRRIGVVGGRGGVQTLRRRLLGHELALRAADVPLDPRLVEVGFRDEDGARAATRRLLALTDPPTALFTANPVCTLGALRVLQATDRRGEVAVVGFDDLQTADLLVPALTVIDHDTQLLGRRAADELFGRIAGRDHPPRRLVLPTELVARGSGELPGPFTPLDLPPRPPATPS